MANLSWPPRTASSSSRRNIQRWAWSCQLHVCSALERVIVSLCCKPTALTLCGRKECKTIQCQKTSDLAVLMDRKCTRSFLARLLTKRRTTGSDSSSLEVEPNLLRSSLCLEAIKLFWTTSHCQTRLSSISSWEVVPKRLLAGTTTTSDTQSCHHTGLSALSLDLSLKTGTRILTFLILWITASAMEHRSKACFWIPTKKASICPLLWRLTSSLCLMHGNGSEQTRWGCFLESKLPCLPTILTTLISLLQEISTNASCRTLAQPTHTQSETSPRLASTTRSPWVKLTYLVLAPLASTMNRCRCSEILQVDGMVCIWEETRPSPWIVRVKHFWEIRCGHSSWRMTTEIIQRTREITPDTWLEITNRL